MYEFHGWFGIAESPEEADAGSLAQGLSDLRVRLSRIRWVTGEVRLAVHNGEYFLTANGLVNRRRDEARELEALLEYVAGRFLGAYGLLYERSDDFTDPPGPGGFHVRVMARGVLQSRFDPFLSPCRPVIED
ncbi:Imm7 family immunity protein [Streptomyces klenkii]|uniref:Imm7 family immunity protein n=1 Tax=Streptomyces klenkii TaxID=1420899 RepID=UPI00343E937D